MGLELANAKWLDGNAKGLLGQFASTAGYTALIAAADAKDYPALAELFESGVSDKVSDVRKELKELAADTDDADVASCCKALRKLADGEDLLIITNGGN